ncbi:MAG: PilZ domain-containing protein [Planctomycetales bacterium]|nr:PilZ domain-containing protein [Planctomycetales bacterium]
MLDICNATSMIAKWNALAVRAALTMSEADFMRCSGPIPNPDGRVRSYERFYYRSKGILHRAGTQYAVYVKDLSRMGVGVISPVQLFPKQNFELELPNGKRYELSVARCRRDAPRSYSCGAVFELNRWS